MRRMRRKRARLLQNKEIFCRFFKAFALSGRQACVHDYPGRCPGLGASALYLSLRSVTVGSGRMALIWGFFLCLCFFLFLCFFLCLFLSYFLSFDFGFSFLLCYFFLLEIMFWFELSHFEINLRELGLLRLERNRVIQSFHLDRCYTL